LRAQSPFEEEVSSARKNASATFELSRRQSDGLGKPALFCSLLLFFLFQKFFCFFVFVGGETVATRLARGYPSINVWTNRQTDRKTKK
jgi:hypothetical protein